MKTIHVIIVEDDFMIAKINQRFTESLPGFEVVHVALRGEECLAYLTENPVDLILLDIYLPDMSGIELLKQVRTQGYPVDCILMTAAHDRATVEESIRMGVFDYLIKPVELERYQESLLNYQKMKSVIDDQGGDFDQKKLDALITCRVIRDQDQDLPKGIARETLRIVAAAVDALGPSFTVDEVVRDLSFSRITARRYLEHFAARGQLLKSFQYKKVGRPTLVYSKNIDGQASCQGGSNSGGSSG
jgi:CitB family two-component system response regulator CitT